MLLSCAKAFSEGTRNVSLMDTPILQLHRKMGAKGRQANSDGSAKGKCCGRG